MKKQYILMAIIVLAFVLPACNSSWECTCVAEVKTSGMEEQSAKVRTAPRPKQPARNVGDTGATSYSSTAYSYTTVSTLKQKVIIEYSVSRDQFSAKGGNNRLRVRPAMTIDLSEQN